jgi:iron complex transport system substrate-binding protein
MLRIASLLPSTTEIACALGFRDALVGRSHECDFPAGVETLPVLTEAKLDARAASRAIDDRVKQLVGEGLSVYRVDAEKLRALAPDVILTQAQCEVCAASLSDVEAALADWTGARPQVVSLQPATLGDVWGDFERVAAAHGDASRGRDLARRLTARIADLGERAARAASERGRPSVACIEWIDPLMSAGNWMPELVSLAGGAPRFGTPGAHSPWLAWEDLVAADPDAILVIPCGFDVARTRAELEPLCGREGFADLRAVRAGRTFLADGNAYFNRPGPRLVESLEILCQMLHPEAFGTATPPTLPATPPTLPDWEPL